ncbi:Aste57867_7541 [Aphanomyces stellatus]|uniref:Aste57867_7541 protein n=1 Tax=Aphanomyces stellatus TaxID=120398 RepID=A0A485KIJ0_9STRA|nr:hypothetical protein As57867_007515 [Aphanomyces stellatus]VFT84450.1 Aste57867_7541 [Aphanomyces stellatus]
MHTPSASPSSSIQTISSPVRLLKPSSWMNLSPPPTHKCLAQFLVVNVVLPVAIYYAAAQLTTDTIALALSAIPPALETLQQVVAYRLLDPISLAQVVSIVLAIAILTVTHEPKVLLLQHSITTFTFGLLMLVSLNWDENLVWRYYREFYGTTDDMRVAMMAQWRDPHTRVLSQRICVVWGIGLLLESTVRVALIALLSVPSMVILSPALAFLFAALLLAWTMHYTKMHNFPPPTSPLSATTSLGHQPSKLYQTM